jgi:hypothetical protein
MFCRSLVVLLSFFSWPLCCLSFFDLRILITPLVSSSFSCINVIVLMVTEQVLCYFNGIDSNHMKNKTITLSEHLLNYH